MHTRWFVNFKQGGWPNGRTTLPGHTYVHLPKDIVAGRLNHNCDISNSTIPFYPVIFLLSPLQLSFYNCIKVMSKYTYKLYAVDWVYSGRVAHVSHNTLQAGSF